MKQILFFLFLIFFISCTKDNEEDHFFIDECDTENVYYISSNVSQSIASIIENKCLECHYTGNMNGPELGNYQDVSIVKNDVFSQIISEEDPMPPIGAPPLTDCEILQIESWINNGLPQYE